MTAKRDKVKAAPGQPGVEFFPLIEQGSAEWTALRLGTPTASVMSHVMAESRDGDASKMRTVLMHKLAGELLTGRPAEGKFVTPAMERGHVMEPIARQHYERSNLEPVERVGFVRRLLPSGRWVGCSPDGLMAKRRRGLEIKTMAPHLMIDRLIKGAAMPPEHRAQVFTTMWIAGLDEVDLLLFYEGMPVAPKFTVERDEKYIKEISDATEVFDHDLAKLVKRIRDMGARR